MNAIIALCHFCELHGPSVLFCTQAFHDSDDPEQRVLNQNDAKNETEKKRYYGRPEYFMRSSSNTAAENSHQNSSNTSKTCEACRASGVSGQPEYLCNDHEARVSYVSSQYPYHPEVFSIVRQACVRSLSCEVEKFIRTALTLLLLRNHLQVIGKLLSADGLKNIERKVCPGREGPIFFGDEQRGHVFSHTFFLKDSQARGFQRWYSIIVVMMDKIFLLNSWPFLVENVRKVIDELQQKATKVYDAEQTECPQRALRLNSVISMTPGNFRRQRGGNMPMRSLSELMNDKEVFSNLHLWFTWILKAGANRLTEKLLEGPPTEDTVIDLEKQEETEEGFMLVTTKKIPKEVLQQFESSGEETDDKLLVEQFPKITNIRHLFMILGKEKFHELAYHVVLGNQVIIYSSKRSLVASIIHSLKALLPKGCFRAIFYSDEYQDSWRCNLLGLPLDTPLPAHVESSPLHLKLRIESAVKDSTDLKDYVFELNSTAELPAKCPAVLTRMESAIQDVNLSDKLLECFFTSVKEEWMNKVKVLFKFSRATSRTSEETQKLLHVLGAQDYDKQLMKFWMTGLSVQFKTHVLSATMSQCHGNEGSQ